MEILPAIDLRGGCCVRLRQGDYAQETVFGDNPAEMAKRWASEGGTRLHLVDLDGAKAGRPVNVDAIKSIVDAIDIPCELGGGLRDEQTIRMMLETIGVDRVIIGTQALKNPEWFRDMVSKFPGRVALGLDARNGFVATAGWLDVSQTRALDLAKQFADIKLAALIYTNIANDGMMNGIDQATVDDMIVLADMGFPVIASGGVSRMSDVTLLTETSRQHPNLVGAIVGRAIYEGTISVSEAVRVAT